MRHEIRETDALELWCRPGAVAGWVCWVVGLASVVTMIVAIIGPRLLWEYAGVELVYSPVLDRVIAYDAVHRLWFCGGLAIGFGVWIAASYALRSRLSRFLQVAVLLPLGYAVAMIVIWLVWPTLANRMPSLAKGSPIVELFPMGWVAAVAGGSTAVAGWLVARRRRDWVHAATMIALVTLLLVGLWLPIAAGFRSSQGAHLATVPSWELVAFVLLPPFFAAVGYAALVSRRPALVRALRSTVIGCVGLLFATALVARLEPSRGAAVIYANFIHVLIALATVAIGALVVLAATIRIGAWRATRAFAADRGRFSGVIAHDDAPIVGRTEITSWLRGPRTVLGSFTVTTATGEVVVPGGAELVAPLPELTTQLAVGESIPVLRSGDRIAVAGFVVPEAHHPFRDSAVLLPGPGRIFVTPADRAQRGLVDVALAVWRPCVTALAILMTVSLIGLAGAIPKPVAEPARHTAVRELKPTLSVDPPLR